MLGGATLERKKSRLKFWRRKGKNLFKAKRQEPRSPIIPAGSFLFIERRPRQRAVRDREVWTNRQIAELGKKGN